MHRPYQKTGFTLLMTAVWLIVLPAAAWAIDISITPASREANKPITFTAISCANCSDFVWEFKKIGDNTVVDSGEGYTVVKTFPIAGEYRVMVTGQQFVNEYGGYYVYVNRSRTFTVTVTPFTITITPNPNWTVVGSAAKGGDGIQCAPETDGESSLCTETYLPGEHLHLKVKLRESAEFLGWEVNDEIMTDEQYLKMLTPKE